jgi:hypothetical protein
MASQVSTTAAMHILRKNRGARRASAMTELIVAATLLIAGLSLLGSVAVRTGKLWQDTRRYQLAIDELTNQLERLTSIDDSEIDEQLAKLTVSPAVEDVLPSARLSGRKLSDDNGTRVMLEIEWDRLGTVEPLKLVGWISPAEDQR